MTQALEDYFVLRNTWFLGSKSAFAWLRDKDPEVHTLLLHALADTGANADLVALVQAIYAPPELTA